MQIINKRAPGRRNKVYFNKGRQTDLASLNEAKKILNDYQPLQKDMLIEYLHVFNDKFGGLFAKHLKALADLTKQSILTLAESGIITLDDLAELDSEELFNILGKDVFANEDDAGSIIMKAREHWFSEIDAEK